jgi:hypothetical protein
MSAIPKVTQTWRFGVASVLPKYNSTTRVGVEWMFLTYLGICWVLF